MIYKEGLFEQRVGEITLTEEIDQFTGWIRRLRQISLEGTIFLFFGLICMALGVFNDSIHSDNLTMAGGFLFIGGVMFITLGNKNN